LTWSLDQTIKQGKVDAMRKHQMIAGFVAVILVAAAAAASAATMRPASSTQFAPTGSLMLNELTVDVNKLPTEDFEDMSLVYSKH
jgi:O-glycosyl hydrolase